MSHFSLYSHYCYGEHVTSLNRQISIVLHSDSQSVEDLARDIAQQLRNNSAPARVLIFGRTCHIDLIRALFVKDSPFHQRLTSASGRALSENDCFGIIWQNGSNAYQAIGHSTITLNQISAEVRYAASMTAQAIFKDTGCLHLAPRGSHFSKTSKAHSDAFIRASNALIWSRHTLTLAYWLQPFISQKASRILVDTSAIASLVYAACHLGIKTQHLSEMPVIDSFRSYEGLSDEDLVDVKNSLFILSASTSGNLAREAFSKQVTRSRLTTLFLLSSDQSDQDALCYLRKDVEKNPEGFDLLQSWKEAECQLCSSGSAPVKIGGDLFLTSLPTTNNVSLLKRHIPTAQRKLLEKFAGTGVFRVHRKIGERISEITIDLTPLLNPAEAESDTVNEFQQSWSRLLRTSISANISHIVYPTYPLSDDLAAAVCSYTAQFVKTSASPTAGNALVDIVPVQNGSAAIVATCVDDPVEMMGISRDLRSLIPGGSASYFVPFLKARSEAEARGICINLTYGDRGLNTHTLHKMYELHLPSDPTEDSWDTELKYIIRLSEWLEDRDGKVPAELLNRRNALRASTEMGIGENIFWPDQYGKALTIRSNFVLLDTDDGKRSLTQADIFVVVSSLLNNLRHIDTNESLRVTQFDRKVISPDDFHKFNDGVIQAAILRAARGNELNYVAADTDNYSTKMRDILLKMLDGGVPCDQEAITEFMLAIAVGRLRVDLAHRDQICQAVVKSREGTEDIASYISAGILSGLV
ncbi:hypothetical protein ACFQPC_09255 [Herminiimonas glaciei]|uniref:Uncharacterized protein n=1 Tax=Herminiimonas glaciei TaxID=523788 RepID=A0ABW2IB77_9BURK